MRDEYDGIRSRGADVIAIGTGSRRYAASFVEDEHIPYPVLVDDDATAAHAAAVKRVGFVRLILDRRSWPGTRRARDAGHHVHRSGKRVTQLGATFVLAPGDQVRYAHIDDFSADHAPIGEVLAALP